MSQHQINRRAFLLWFGGGALASGASSFLMPQPVKAMERLKAWWSNTPCDLSQEIQSLRALLAERHHPDFQLGCFATGKPPGCRLAWYESERIKRNEAVFAAPARCTDDVLSKYAMFEETGWRDFTIFKSRFPSERKQHFKLFGHWFEQLEKDVHKFGININPWWQEGKPVFSMINDKRVVWTDDRWELYVTPKSVLALIEERRKARKLV